MSITISVKSATIRQNQSALTIDWIGIAIRYSWLILPGIGGDFYGYAPTKKLFIRNESREIIASADSFQEFEYFEQSMGYLFTQGESLPPLPMPEICGTQLTPADISAALRDTQYKMITRGLKLNSNILVLRLKPVLFTYDLHTMEYIRVPRVITRCKKQSGRHITMDIPDGTTSSCHGVRTVEQFPTIHIQFTVGDTHTAVVYPDDCTGINTSGVIENPPEKLREIFALLIDCD